jgi:integrase
MTIDSHKFQLKQINLYGGDVKLFTTKESGGNWQVKIWVKEAQKYLRKSLRTRDEEYARYLAEQEYVQIRAKRLNKEPIFSPQFHDVIDEYFEIKRKEGGVSITEGRVATIKTQLNWLKKFQPQCRCEDLEKSHFANYYNWRKQKKPKVQNVTLLNEKATINAVLKLAINRGYLPYTFVVEYPRLKKNAGKRSALDIQEWRTMYNFMKSKKFLDDGDRLKTREFIYLFSLLLVNTGIRFGEARRLQWKHIKKMNRKDETKPLIEINLLADMTKNGKDRTVIGRRGEIIDRIRRISNYTSPNDYVFVNNNSGNQIKKDNYYNAWNFMLKAIGFTKHEYHKDITFYCLRHTYATWRLYAGVNPYALSKNLGTGLQYLQEHYGQVEIRMMAEQLTGDISEEIRVVME